MRVVVHDYSGHPGQVQLSRALAERGHVVAHQHCPSYVTGKGGVGRRPGDAPTITFEDVPMRGAFRRYAPITRVLQEVLYGFTAARAIRRIRPDVAVLCNIPLIAHAIACSLLVLSRIPQVFWQQDVYSEAITQTARRRLGRAGLAIGWIARRLEMLVAWLSARIVCIAPAFKDELSSWRVPAEKVAVIPNWGPLDDIRPRSKDNPWARRHGLADREIVLYSGTLGLKHDPSVLLVIAEWMRDERSDARLVVVSEGRGRQWLEEQEVVRRGLPQLLLFDFQPYEDLPDMLGAADLVLAVLDAGASRFSVPSKVLTYLCAGRPVVGIMPESNFIAKVIAAGPGAVVPPGDARQARDEVSRLLTQPEERRSRAAQARAYAEENFSIDQLVGRFEVVLNSARRVSSPVIPEPRPGASARSRLPASREPVVADPEKPWGKDQPRPQEKQEERNVPYVIRRQVGHHDG